MRIVCSGGLALVMLISAAMGQTAAPAKSEGLPTVNHFDASVVDRNLDPCVEFYRAGQN